NRIADLIADREVAADLALIGVHIVHRVAQAAEMIASKQVLSTVVREYPVAAFRDLVVQDLRSRGVPDGHAVASLVDAQAGVADDAVALDQRIAGAPQIDADRIVDDVVVLDARAFS